MTWNELAPAGARGLDRSRIDVLDRFGIEFTDHSGRMQRKRKNARQRAEADRSHENDAHDEFGHRAQCH